MLPGRGVDARYESLDFYSLHVSDEPLSGGKLLGSHLFPTSHSVLRDTAFVPLRSTDIFFHPSFIKMSTHCSRSLVFCVSPRADSNEAAWRWATKHLLESKRDRFTFVFCRHEPSEVRPWLDRDTLACT